MRGNKQSSILGLESLDSRDANPHAQGLQCDEPTVPNVSHAHQWLGRRPFASKPQAQVRPAAASCQPAPSVWADARTNHSSVEPLRCGMGKTQFAREPLVVGSSIAEGTSYAQIGRGRIAVRAQIANTSTSVQVAAQPITALTRVPKPKPRIQTPLIASEWLAALENAKILDRYPQIPNFISYGADAGIAPIISTFTPSNHPSIISHQSIFKEIVDIEFSKGRYWGPFSKNELERIIGPFQTSPLSLIPKPGKPGKFRLIQNLSYPRKLDGVQSINSSIESDLYPCSWGTFSSIAVIVRSLPPGSLGACRDVSEAYRIIPLAKDQWPGIVVRLEEDSHLYPRPFALNTCTCFGKKSSGGLFGLFGDALLDILRAAGIGPSLRWVDDFIFFQLERKFLEEYNKLREKWRSRISANGGRQQKGGRFWYKGGTMPNGQSEEFAEDMSQPLKDLSTS